MQNSIISPAQGIDSVKVQDRIMQAKVLSLPEEKNWKSFLTPSICITYGFANLGKDTRFNIDLLYQHRSKFHGGISRPNIGDYFQYIPTLGVYALDVFGVKPKHNFWQRTKILAAGNIFMTLGVNTIKQVSSVQRPDKSNFQSFPSGHTATVFLAADFFYQEFKYKKTWWIYSGYLVAGLVGTLRIIDNEHWISDVVAGAGFGILSNRVSYIVFDKGNRKRKLH